MPLVFLIPAWGIVGWSIICCFAGRDPNDPCPNPSWKCFIAFLFGIVGGLAYYYLMGFKNNFTSVDFIASVICAAALGRFVYSLFCPIPLKPTR